MTGLAVNEVLSKYFFSMKNSKTPMRNSIISMVVNIAFAYMLFGVLKTPGLALAAACGSICNALLNAFSLRDRKLLSGADFIQIFKIFASALIMSAVVFLLYSVSKAHFTGFNGNILICALCGAVGAIVYFASALVFKIDIIMNIIKKER